MRSIVLNRYGHDEPVEIDPFDKDAVDSVGADWSEWLQEKGLSGLDESSWSIDSGALIADGATGVTRKGKSVTPPAPSITAGQAVSTITSGMAIATVYIDTAVRGDRIVVRNHVRAGTVMDEASFFFMVVDP